MNKKSESYFYIQPSNILKIDDRLDYSFWHPRFKEIIKIYDVENCEVKELSDLLISPIISGKTSFHLKFLRS